MAKDYLYKNDLMKKSNYYYKLTFIWTWFSLFILSFIALVLIGDRISKYSALALSISLLFIPDISFFKWPLKYEKYKHKWIKKNGEPSVQ